MLMYAWAVNKNKLDRAIVAAGSSAPEEAVKAKYVSLGGLLRENAPKEEVNDFEEDKPKKGKSKKADAETEGEE